MKLSLLTPFGATCLLALSSCYVWEPPAQQLPPPAPGPNRYMAVDQSREGPPPPPPNTMTGPVSSDPLDPNAPPTTEPDPSVPPPTDPAISPDAPPPTAQAPAPPPYGVKVPGKTGFVYSPYDRTAGVVDVQGMAPGTKVKCPYTGKVFIVP